MKDPETLEELCDYIYEYRDSIYIREKNKDGKYDSLALSELTVPQAIFHALRFVKERRVPHRLVESTEDK